MCVCVTQSGLTLQPHQLYSPPGSSVQGDSAGKNTGVGCHFLPQGIFPRLPHCRQIFFPLSDHTLEMGANAQTQWVGSLKYAYLMLDLRGIPYNRKSCVCSMLHYLNLVFFFLKIFLTCPMADKDHRFLFLLFFFNSRVEYISICQFRQELFKFTRLFLPSSGLMWVNEG